MMSNQVDHSALTDHWAGFQFKTIHDSRRARSRSVDDVAHTEFNGNQLQLTHFLDLVTKLPIPPTCINSDGFPWAFTIDATNKLGIPVMLYWTRVFTGFSLWSKTDSYQLKI